MILSREPSRSASFTTLSRTRAVSPVRGDQGERTTISPPITVALVNRTQAPQPGIVSTGPVGFDWGQSRR